VNDFRSGIDLVYNYGTFDFETPNFYLKFMGGRLDYMLSVVPFRYFIIEYSNEKRWVKAQILNLSQSQKQKIFNFLQNNALPEHKFYRYDFFFDNCATRIKDVLKYSLDGDFMIGKIDLPENESFRDLIQPYLTDRKWGRFGINIGLGLPTDRIAANEETTFLPDYLGKVMSVSKVKSGGSEKPLVVSEIILYKPQEDTVFKAFPVSPALLFWGFLAVVIFITFYEFRKNKSFFLIDSILFFFTGFAGSVMLILWTATEHSTVVNNLNLIWAIPTHLIMAFFLIRKKRIRLIRYYFAVSAIVAAFGLIFFPFSPQGFDTALIPVIIAEMIRSSAIFYQIKIKGI
jgi:hypothetical protein